MKLWVFLLIVFGGLLLIGFLYDKWAGRRVNLRNRDDAADPYGETLIHSSRHDQDPPV